MTTVEHVGKLFLVFVSLVCVIWLWIDIKRSEKALKRSLEQLEILEREIREGRK